MSLDSAPRPVWTCPFCPLACDHLAVRVDERTAALTLDEPGCERAARALAMFGAPTTPAALVDGAEVALDDALATAARCLRASRQPLFAGLGTDVDGTRALYALACATGAVVDSAGGDALVEALRALQDRGQFTTTLAEVRTRADVIVFIGGLPTALAPLIAQRLGIGDPQVAHRRVIVIGPSDGDAATLQTWASAAVSVECVPLQGDLFATLGLLAAVAAGRRPPAVPEALARVIEHLQQARYGVLVGAPPRLPAHAALLIEAVHRIVGSLNRSTRAAALWIGGGNGAATVNQTLTWLSGLPVRSRAGPRGLEHEPLLFGAQRLLDDGAVDALLWVSAFDAAAVPPATSLPTVVLGPPAQAAACRRTGVVFIPVATPGIATAGHLFRTDGTVLMPLAALRDEPLPTVSEVARRLLPLCRTERAA